MKKCTGQAAEGEDGSYHFEMKQAITERIPTAGYSRRALVFLIKFKCTNNIINFVAVVVSWILIIHKWHSDCLYEIQKAITRPAEKPLD